MLPPIILHESYHCQSITTDEIIKFVWALAFDVSRIFLKGQNVAFALIDHFAIH